MNEFPSPQFGLEYISLTMSGKGKTSISYISTPETIPSDYGKYSLKVTYHPKKYKYRSTLLSSPWLSFCSVIYDLSPSLCFLNTKLGQKLKLHIHRTPSPSYMKSPKTNWQILKVIAMETQQKQ